MKKLSLALSLVIATLSVLVFVTASPSVRASDQVSLPLHFDFESGLQGWHIRDTGDGVYGILGSARTVAATCPSCPGVSAFEFQVDLSHSPENRGQASYLFPEGSELMTTVTFSAWVWIPEYAPTGLEAEFFVQSGEDWSYWTASRPRQSLKPGEWRLLTGGGAWSDGAWTSRTRLMGIEIKAKDEWPIPEGALPIRIDQVHVMAAGQALYLPLTLRNQSPPRPPEVVWDYRGASLAGYWEYAYAPQGNAYAMIDELKATGVNAVTVLATWYQDGFTTTEIITQSMTPRTEDIAALVDYAHQQGIQVALKPHIDPLLGWRAEISPTNAISWFHNFKYDFLLPYAELAEAHDVELFVIGAEYQNLMSPTHIDHWADVIASVRQVYSGKITYAATEHTLFSNVIPDWFWESLDIVGLTFYHEFSTARTPEVAEVVEAWNESGVVEDLWAFHQRYGLPVLLAEVGYRSIDYAGFQPYRTEGPNAGAGVNPERSIAYNGAGQANMYEGLFQVLGDKEWVAGAFMWQFVPRGGCAGIIRGGIGNNDYTILGKPSALVVQDWFGEIDQSPPQWLADPANSQIDSFEYWAAESVPAAWQVTTSGEVTFTIDTKRYPSQTTATRSIMVETHVPVEDDRFQQMDYFFCDGDRDWRSYNSLELWVRTDQQSVPPEGCELAIGLIDGRSQEREYWQSSRWLERQLSSVTDGGWRRIQVALQGAPTTERDPWRHPTDFVIPQWEDVVDGMLDLAAIRGVRVKSLTTEEDPAYPDCTVWLSAMRASTETIEVISPPTPPLLDAFEYQTSETVEKVWETPENLPGTVNLAMDSSRSAPNAESDRSLHIHTYTPCADPRFEEMSNTFLGGGVDLSAYESLELWAGGDLIAGPPYGGEFSIVIEDKDGERWQSTRWLNRTIQGQEYQLYGLEPVRISLMSYVADPSANPWHHPADFVLLDDGTQGNRRLDRDLIRSVRLKTLTTDEYCNTYPHYDVWVDQFVASQTPVVPPDLISLPVVDHFEYADSETARLIWKWVSSGQINVTMDTDIHAPGSDRSLHIHSDIPVDSERYGQVFNIFLNGPQDFSPYRRIRFWAQTRDAEPWGGELSIELVETNPATGVQEVWRNTRWFGNSEGAWIEVSLGEGANIPADPWNPSYKDVFVVPRSDVFDDGILDLTRITEIRLIPLTTSEAAQEGHTEFDLWVDEMTLE